jgi:hypothetical protein
MTKIAREIAEKEVTEWLDRKKISPSTRESREDSIDLLIDCVCEGTLVFNKNEQSNEIDGTITHSLLFPTDGEAPITSLKYRARLNDNILRPFLKGVAGNDGDGRLTAYVAALTNTAKGIISALDSGDKKISLAIAVFFL